VPDDPQIAETVIDALVAEVDPDYVIPMHCTGANFSYIMSQKHPEKLIQSYVGTAIVFGA
jgi:7,8-dihydropterin-6-yl-methyl-4-(beta-D-ribofuranosyl)aminobenzene 5'-phosphate synthase